VSTKRRRGAGITFPSTGRRGAGHGVAFGASDPRGNAVPRLLLAALFAALAFAPAVVSAESAPAAETPRALFIFAYSPGPAWIEGKPMHEQNLLPHGRYISALHKAGRIFAAGPYGDRDGGVALVWAKDREEADATLAADPAIVDGLFVAEIRAWAPRFVSDEALKPVIPAGR